MKRQQQRPPQKKFYADELEDRERLREMFPEGRRPQSLRQVPVAEPKAPTSPRTPIQQQLREAYDKAYATTQPPVHPVHKDGLWADQRRDRSISEEWTGTKSEDNRKSLPPEPLGDQRPRMRYHGEDEDRPPVNRRPDSRRGHDTRHDSRRSNRYDDDDDYRRRPDDRRRYDDEYDRRYRRDDSPPRRGGPPPPRRYERDYRDSPPYRHPSPPSPPSPRRGGERDYRHDDRHPPPSKPAPQHRPFHETDSVPFAHAPHQPPAGPPGAGIGGYGQPIPPTYHPTPSPLGGYSARVRPQQPYVAAQPYAQPQQFGQYGQVGQFGQSYSQTYSPYGATTIPYSQSVPAYSNPYALY